MSSRPSSRRSRTAPGPTSAGPRRPRSLKLGLALVGALLVGLPLLYWAGNQAHGRITTGGSPQGPRAVIVDQLDLSDPNPAFAESATRILTKSGYEVDYYQGSEVTVNFYRELPRRDYDLVILRVHSGVVNEIDLRTGTETLTDEIAMATGELYDETKYVSALGRSYPGLAAYRSTPRLFGFTPDFIRLGMEGRFDKSTIILMGCDGLFSTKAAEAFRERGAGSFVSWTGLVSAAHSDAATERLLRHLLIDGHTAAEAVAKTMAEVGPDPEYGSELRLYPSQG